MWDPYVTRELTVRDLLVHRSGLGLGAGDLLWWPASTYDRKEIAQNVGGDEVTQFAALAVRALAIVVELGDGPEQPVLKLVPFLL